jgi:peptide chain release factor 1
MSMQEKLASIKARHEELAALMSAGGLSGADFVRLSKEYAGLEPVVAAINERDKALAEKEDIMLLIDDPEMREMANADLKVLLEKIPELEQNLRLALIPKDEADSRNAILEIRAGTGGDEAALFAADLFAMYRGYAVKRGWKFEVMDASESALGGYKEIICMVTGKDVFARLKYESGGHRVQRVPKTEAQGRIHTSAATVAVLPEAEEAEININPADLKIDTYRSQGAGGQHVNKTESAIRITHIPTGVVVEMQEERSQHKNRAKAMKVLATRIYDQQQGKLDAERAQTRKLQVGSGDRSQRIRTYNFPQGRVTDHRINLTIYNLDAVVGGDLDQIIEPLITEDQAAALATLDS